MTTDLFEGLETTLSVVFRRREDGDEVGLGLGLDLDLEVREWGLVGLGVVVVVDLVTLRVRKVLGAWRLIRFHQGNLVDLGGRLVEEEVVVGLFVVVVVVAVVVVDDAGVVVVDADAKLSHHLRLNVTRNRKRERGGGHGEVYLCTQR